VIRDLAALAVANGAVIAAGHGVLRVGGIRPAAGDLAWTLGAAYVAGAAGVGVLGSLLLVFGLPLLWWQLLLLCATVAALGLLRRGGLRTPARVVTVGWERVLPAAILVVLSVLAIDLAVQPLWGDDAWSIWGVKAVAIVALDGLDPAFLSSASVLSADYPLVVPVLELVALRFSGLPSELVVLQLGLVFCAFPCALVAFLRDRSRPLVLWTVVLAIALAPTLQIQVASAVADVTLAVFFGLAGVAGWQWIERGEGGLLWLTGVFGAAAVGTKAEGAVFVAFLLGALAVAAARRGRSPAGVGVVAAAVAATAAPWVLWSRAHELGNAVSEAGGLGSTDLIAAAERLPRAAAALAWEVVDPTSWLALAAIAVAAVVVGLRHHAGRGAAAYTLFVSVACLTVLLAVYWATPLDFDYHVATSVRRVVTVPVVFAASMAPLLLGPSAGAEGVAVDR